MSCRIRLNSSTAAQPGKIGFTKTVNAGRYKAGQPNVQTLCGMLMHSSLAVTLTGIPIGLTAVKFWTRTKFKGTLALMRHIGSVSSRAEGVVARNWRLSAYPAARVTSTVVAR
ncbi:hypothetical protein ACFQX4_28890, partial [Roseomonas sp. GCM10028921]